ARLYADRARGKSFCRSELKAIARGVGEGITFQKHKGYSLSASEVFFLLNEVVAREANGKTVQEVRLEETPLGPTSRVAPQAEVVTTDASQLKRTSVDVAGYLRKHGRLPGAVWLGSTAVPPEAYLHTVAKVALDLLEGRQVPAKVEVSAGIRLAVAKHVS